LNRASFAGFAAYVFAFVANPLALIGLRRAHPTNACRHLAHHFLVNARYTDLTIVLFNLEGELREELVEEEEKEDEVTPRSAPETKQEPAGQEEAKQSAEQGFEHRPVEEPVGVDFTMLINATQLRVGMIIKHQNELCRIMNVLHVTPGNWRGMVQTKLRNLRTGTQTENRFRSEDKVERVTLEQHEMEFLYQSDDQYYFMNTESYEQVPLSEETLGDAVQYLTPNLRLQVEFHDGTNPVAVALPKTVDLTVKETMPGLKGATVTNVLKPATTETGLVVQVPNFIEIGEVIRVDTETGEYVSRAK